MRKSLLFAVLFSAGAAWGQAYPSKSVTVLNGFPPGGATDLTLRQVSAKLSERLGQPVVIENRAGAAGTIAAAAVARAPADGHTLLFGVAANLAVAPAAMKNRHARQRCAGGRELPVRECPRPRHRPPACAVIQ